MSSTQRRRVGIALGALLAYPVVALLAGPVARADDLVTIGPFTLDGDTDTLSINTDTFALDGFLVATSNSLPFDVDVYSGAPGSGTSELLFTVPSLFQLGVDDVAGTLTPLYSFDPADFISPDVGLGSL